MSGERLGIGFSAAMMSTAISVAALSACDRRGRADEAATRSQAIEAGTVRADGGVSDRSVPLESTHDADAQVIGTAGRAEPCSSKDNAAGICCSVRSSLVYAPVRHRDCDAARCAARGGRCGWAGFACPEACIAPARDRGQPCSDVAECEGTCVAPGNIAKGEPATGRCYDWALALECLNRVRQGRAEGTVCIE